jgi:hypothetical protein
MAVFSCAGFFSLRDPGFSEIWAPPSGLEIESSLKSRGNRLCGGMAIPSVSGTRKDIFCVGALFNRLQPNSHQQNDAFSTSEIEWMADFGGRLTHSRKTISLPI